MKSFVDACVEAPIGAAVLALLESSQRPDLVSVVENPTADPTHVSAAVRAVMTMSFGDLCKRVLIAAAAVGPWTVGAEREAWAAYRHVNQRRPIADAIGVRFFDELHAPASLEAQEWWLHADGAAGAAPLFHDLGRVYENGELSWGALRSYAPASDQSLDGYFGEARRPSTYWALPVKGSPKIYEIHRPGDWHDLCRRYPSAATGKHGTWALPGPNVGDIGKLCELPNQHAASAIVDVHLCPNWSQLVLDFDAVHLSWAGFITTEGYVHTIGTVTTVLRYWDREVTMWLTDCFGDPTPLRVLQDSSSLVDVATGERLEQDRAVIRAMLNRSVRF